MNKKYDYVAQPRLNEIECIEKLLKNPEIANCKTITRDFFCRTKKWISEHTIKNVFGSFQRFKDVFGLCSVKPVQVTLTDNETPSVAEQTSHAKEQKYIYNKETGDYVFDFTNISNIGNVITLKDTQVYAIVQDYSNFDKSPKTINDIALKHKIPAFVLKKILHA